MSMPPLSYFDIQKSDLAFIGTCQKVINEKGRNFAIFKVNLLLKGETQYKTRAKVLSRNNGTGECMQRFEAGQKWLVITKNTIFGYYPSLCDNNEYVEGNGLTFIRNIAPGFPFSPDVDSGFFYEKNEIRIKGKFVKGKEEGYWYYYYQNQLRYKILYQKGEIKEIHRMQKGCYKLIVFNKNSNIVRVKEVCKNDKEKAFVKYTPNYIMISYFTSGFLGDYKITINKATKEVIYEDKKGKIASRQNFLDWHRALPVNLVHHFFMRDCWYLDIS